MKHCYGCNSDLAPDLFTKNKSKPDGFADECRTCKAKRDKAYREANKLKIKASKHESYLKNKDVVIARVNDYINRNRGKHNEWATNSKNRLKTEIMSHYCGGDLKCKNCPVKDLDILTIDHVNGDGAEHRREIGIAGGGGYPMYQWLKKNGLPEGFQVLCYNCQYRKRAVELKPESPTHLQEVRAAYARSIKVECLDNYGGRKCPCGEDDITTLSLDHVNDDGAEHRRETGTRGQNFYHMLRKKGFPQEPPLQVACMNCQIKKRNGAYVA